MKTSSLLMVPLSALLTALLCTTYINASPVSTRQRGTQDESFPVDSIAGVIRAHLLGPGSFYPGQLSDGSQNVVGYQGDRDSLNDFDLSDFNNALLEKLKTTGRVNGYSSLFPDQGIQDDRSVSRLAHPPTKRGRDRHISSVLPPWNELCRLLNMAYCKRFRRSVKSVPEIANDSEWNM